MHGPEQKKRMHMKLQREKSDPSQIAHDVLLWLRSDEARQATAEGERNLAELARRFEQARAIDARELHEPFTV
jgi:hypothetical protein